MPCTPRITPLYSSGNCPKRPQPSVPTAIASQVTVTKQVIAVTPKTVTVTKQAIAVTPKTVTVTTEIPKEFPNQRMNAYLSVYALLQQRMKAPSNVLFINVHISLCNRASPLSRVPH